MLNNALKFTQQGTVYISVCQSHEIVADQNYYPIQIQVIDTGIGIPKAQQQQIFKNFTQADNSTTRKYGGTGLGLAICKQLSEQMQGLISIVSETEKGSCFTLEIPFARDPNIELFSCRKRLKGKHILLFNILAESRRIFLEILKDTGAQVSHYQCLENIEIQLKQNLNQYDALLLVGHDANFHINTFAGQLQRAYPDLPMLTINGLDHEIGKDYESQMHEPFRLQDFIQNIEKLFQTETDNCPHSNNTLEVAPAISQSEYDLCGKYILVVEDIPLNQRIVSDMLGHFGIKVACVNDGFEAITAWKQQQYDLILMDCRMPNMDGYAATEEIRRQEKQQQKPRIPIFALTANALLEDIKKCTEAGMDNIITKPIQQEQLQKTLLNWFKNEKLTESKQAAINLDKPLLDEENMEQLYQNLSGGFYDIINTAKISLLEFEQQLQNNIKAIKKDKHEQNLQIIQNLEATALTLGLLRLAQKAEWLEQNITNLDWQSFPIQIQLLSELQQQSLTELDSHLNIYFPLN